MQCSFAYKPSWAITESGASISSMYVILSCQNRNDIAVCPENNIYKANADKLIIKGMVITRARLFKTNDVVI